MWKTCSEWPFEMARDEVARMQRPAGQVRSLFTGRHRYKRQTLCNGMLAGCCMLDTASESGPILAAMLVQTVRPAVGPADETGT